MEIELTEQPIPLEQTVEISAPTGLHARPAAQMAAIARRAEKTVWIEANGERVEAASTLDLLSLGCGRGCRVRLSIETPSDIGVLMELVTFIKQDFLEKTDHA